MDLNYSGQGKPGAREREGRMNGYWTHLGEWDGFEYWRKDTTGQDATAEVFRRRPCVDNYFAPDGTPSALRWEGSFAWFQRFIAGRLPV